MASTAMASAPSPPPSAPSTSAAAATAPSSLDDVVSLAPSGVVLPPPDIRKIVETTAGYVVRNGPAFETRMRNFEANNPRFSFLDPADAYNSYYVWRMDEIKAGRGTDVSAGRAGNGAGGTGGASTSGMSKAAAARKRGPDPPAELEFSFKMPNISAQDLDIVRLTAQFAAKNGRGWVTALAQKEGRNFQFDFLHPNHSLNPFFNRLVDQYVSLLPSKSTPPPEHEIRRLKSLQTDVDNRFGVLTRARHRAEYTRFQASQKQKEEEQAEKDRQSFMEIDWHTFVVVETITFTDADDRIDLPAPTSLSDLQSASLEQKAMMSLAPAGMRIEEAMPTGDVAHIPTPVLVHSIPPPLASASVTAATTIPVTATTTPTTTTPATTKPAPSTGPMKIREDYVPVAQPRRYEQKTAMCPKCKQQIDLAEWDQHMRIELLDPEWRAQKATEAARASGSMATNNAHASIDIANNLKRLASQRTDIFDTAATGSTATTSANGAGQARPDDQYQLRNKVIRTSGAGDVATGLPLQSPIGPAAPGQVDTHEFQAMSIQDQIKRLHQKYAGQ